MNSSMLVSAYFRQGRMYYSSKLETLIPIETMNPQHAANAAEKLLRDSRVWAEDACPGVKRPQLWMIATPLHQALVARAASEDMPPFVKVVLDNQTGRFDLAPEQKPACSKACLYAYAGQKISATQHISSCPRY